MAPTQEPAGQNSHISESDRDSAPLLQDSAFWGMTATQFLGAFNDNLFKQLLLLLSVAVATGASVSATGSKDLQWVALFVFSLPFILFSGFAGFLSDRHGKRRVIVLSKVAEIVVMLLGMAALIAYTSTGLIGPMAVLFLMGTQSAFFGPGKYGILPEMLRPRDLPRANGIILMTTFLAIILGTAAAGLLKDQFAERLWIASGACVMIAVVGTATSLLIRRVPPAAPGLRYRATAMMIHPDMWQLLRREPLLLSALLASCMFWLVGGLVQPTVNALGIRQFGLGDLHASLMSAGMALGIAGGCVVAGQLSRGKIDSRLVRVGALGIVICLVLLSLPGSQHGHLLGIAGSVPTLILLGFFAGMFVLPIQVFLQSRPPAGEKGRMIATMNLANWIAIITSALLYLVFGKILAALSWQPSAMFAFIALLMLPVAIFYRPGDEQLAQ